MRKLVIAALVALAFIPAVSRAQEGGKLAVAVIDVQRIVEESAVGKEAKARLAKMAEDKRAQAAKIQTDGEALEKQLNTQASTLSDAKRAELAKQIEDKRVELQRFQEDAQQQLNEAQRKEMSALESKVMPLINELGRELKLQMIFNKYQSGLVYADDAVDITDQVLRRFNSQVTK